LAGSWPLTGRGRVSRAVVEQLDEPEPDEPERSVAVRRLLWGYYEGSCTSLLSMVENHMHEFDVVYMTRAMRSLAVTARDQQLPTREIQQIKNDPTFVKLFHRAKASMMEDMSAVTWEACSDMLWSCSILSIYDSELFNAIVQDATTRLHEYSSGGICDLFVGLGLVELCPHASFMQALFRELRLRIPKGFDEKELCTIVYTLMSLDIKNDRIMKLITDHILSKGIHDFEDLTVSWYAYMKVRYWNDELFAPLGRRAVSSISNTNQAKLTMNFLVGSRGLSARVLSGGKFRVATEEVFEGPGPKQPSSFRWQWSDNVACSLVEQVLTFCRIDKVTLSELSLINYCAMRMNLRDDELLLRAARQFASFAPELSSVEIANAMYTFSRQDYTHVDFIYAMLNEVKRRGVAKVDDDDDDTDGPSLCSLMCYSLGACHIRDEEFMGQVAAHVCEKGSMMGMQSLSMIMWAFAVTGCDKNAKPLVSVVLGELSKRQKETRFITKCIILWASALLAGNSCGLSILKVLFSKGFWSGPFTNDSNTCFFMLQVFLSLGAECGIDIEQLRGWTTCQEFYDSVSVDIDCCCNQRRLLSLSERLHDRGISHEKDTVPPVLDGFNEARVRGDIVIESCQLIIEVDRPLRMTIPVGQEEDEDDLDGALALFRTRRRRSELHGRPEEVVPQMRDDVELGYTGPQVFKRRLLRACGWRVVTLRLDENEEYIAEALFKIMFNKGLLSNHKGWLVKSNFSSEEEWMLCEVDEDADLVDMDVEEGFGFPWGLSSIRSSIRFTSDSEVDDKAEEEEDDEGLSMLSDYERDLRRRVTEASEELQRRIVAEQGGDAAASAKCADHLAYHSWHAEQEKNVLREMLASM